MGKRISVSEELLKVTKYCDDKVQDSNLLRRWIFHEKDREALKPRLEKSNNREFWISKISRNRERSDEINKRLLLGGWTIIWF